MSLAIHDDHVALAEAARGFLARHCPPAVGRQPLEDVSFPAGKALWAEIAGLGWPGLHLPEELGGQGYGLPELAIVLEEMGRGAVPGPFLPTALAAAVIAESRSEEARKRWLPSLADGSVTAAILLPAAGHLTAAGSPGSVTVSGVLRPVLGGAGSGVMVCPAQNGSDRRWFAVALDQAEVKELGSLDPSRPLSSVSVGEAPAEELGGVDDRTVGNLTAALLAAEAAGGAAWCLDTATEYAKVREQFGRPIGQFQAVKHRLAGMLIAVEQIRAAAWDAAAALSSDPDDEGTSLACAVAGAVAGPLFLEVAEGAIQVLGGIGFTWEHDAHRYLRRASSTVSLLGGSAPWRRRVADLATKGTRRSGGSGLAGDHDELRREVRAAVETVAARPREERRRALVEAGLLVPHWPRPWGRDAGPVEQIIIDEELERARVRRPNLAVGAWAAPTIVAHGTAEQQDRWVGPTLLGEIKWCQLFSEPGAGSDLASLTTRATRTDGGWLINGQKVWTSMATEAQWGICLARTDPEAPKHLGITYFVLDMSRLGIEVRPLRELTGMAMFNEVFLTDVFVPDSDVVGPVDGGWSLARTTLANERVAMGSGSSFGGGVEALLALVAQIGPLEPVTVDSLGELLSESHCLSVMGRRSAHRALAGASPGPEASVRKLLGAEHDQRTQEFGLSLLGPEGATTEGPAAQWTFGFLANRCLTIAGGTSEVQRNVIGERILGLPRDPG